VIDDNNPKNDESLAINLILSHLKYVADRLHNMPRNLLLKINNEIIFKLLLILCINILRV